MIEHVVDEIERWRDGHPARQRITRDMPERMA